MAPSQPAPIDAPVTAASGAELNVNALRSQGLAPERIQLHAERIRSVLLENKETSIPIVDACTINNGGVVPWKSAMRFVHGAGELEDQRFQDSAFEHWRLNHCVTCIPAAGAASRFLAEIERFAVDLVQRLPELGAARDAFFNGEASVLDTSVRKAAQTALLNTTPQKMPVDLAGRLQQRASSVCAKDAAALLNYLARLISTGSAPARKKGNGTSPQGAPGPADGSHSQRRTRIHWSKQQAFGRNRNRPGIQIPPNEPWPTSRDVFLGPRETQIVETFAAASALLHHFRSIPKALVPTTLEGDTFLLLKLAEQIALFPTLGNVLITPPGRVEEFQGNMHDTGSQLTSQVRNIFDLNGTPFSPAWLKEREVRGDWVLLEQGPKLSTVRFRLDGTPLVDEAGAYSPVAAGHGELVHLFEDVAARFPTAECLHIRNIDNIIGTSEQRQAELGVLAQTFRITRDGLEYLREKVRAQIRSGKDDGPLADRGALAVLQMFLGLQDQRPARELERDCHDRSGRFTGVPLETLVGVLGELFFWPGTSPSEKGRRPQVTWQWVDVQLSRPLSVLGVVRKEATDTGGGPVFASLPDASIVKLCMEMPHARADDSQLYFGSRGRATHFNPVLVFFELRTHCAAFSAAARPGEPVQARHLYDDRFWLLARKEFHGEHVCYHETVLYELLGNSATTNLLFVEVPRTLFNPHKSIFESLEHDRHDYGFGQTLASQEETRDPS